MVERASTPRRAVANANSFTSVTRGLPNKVNIKTPWYKLTYKLEVSSTIRGRDEPNANSFTSVTRGLPNTDCYTQTSMTTTKDLYSYRQRENVDSTHDIGP